MNQSKNEALTSLIQLSQSKGYLLIEDILNCTENLDLTLQDVNWLSNEIAIRGIIVYDERPASNIYDDPDEYDDYAQTDYEAIFSKVIELSPSLEPFIEEVRQIVPPQYKEVSKLKYQIVEGNQYARKRLIEMHIRVAVRIALQRAEAYDLDIEETIGDACIGLINAVDKYDPDTSGPFSSYASAWIFQNVTREQATRRQLVYYPAHKKEQFFKMYPILKEYGCASCKELYKCSEVKKIIHEQVDCTEEQANDIVIECVPIESLDSLFEDNNDFDDQDGLFDLDGISLVCPESSIYENIEYEVVQETVHDMLNDLRNKERNVICARFGIDNGKEQTLEEIAQHYHVTRERIRQIEGKGLRKLSFPNKKEKLKKLLQ